MAIFAVVEFVLRVSLPLSFSQKKSHIHTYIFLTHLNGDCTSFFSFFVFYNFTLMHGGYVDKNHMLTCNTLTTSFAYHIVYVSTHARNNLFSKNGNDIVYFVCIPFDWVIKRIQSWHNTSLINRFIYGSAFIFSQISFWSFFSLSGVLCFCLSCAHVFSSSIFQEKKNYTITVIFSDIFFPFSRVTDVVWPLSRIIISFRLLSPLPHQHHHHHFFVLFRQKKFWCE